MFKAQAIILAGGIGSRMRPYTNVLPKPLLPLGEHPIIEVVIKQLRKNDIRDIAISIGYLGELIEAYLGNGSKYGVNIKYVREDKPLGTAGAIKIVKSIDDDCLVINGDILTDMNFRELIDFHKKSKDIATISIKERVVKTDFGVIEIDIDKKLSDYIEKPMHKSFVSMGVYVINKKCKKYIREGECIGLPELMMRMKSRNETIGCYLTRSLWFDMGRLDDFESASDVFAKKKKRFL